MNFAIKSSKLSGSVIAPPSKSHTMRAILFASLANGKSIIYNYLRSPDTQAMIQACKQFGTKIDFLNDCLVVEGTNGKVGLIDDVINAGNSGQVLRFITAISTLSSSYTVITGDYSIRHYRSMQPVINGLNGLNAFCASSKKDGFAPIITKGPLRPGKIMIYGKDSQPVSALIMATSFLSGTTEIYVKNPGEKPWIDVTLSWLNKIGAQYKNNNYEHYVIYGNAKYNGFEYTVPGDFSSILFPISAALITKSKITLEYVDMEDVQGDKKVLDVLKKMGAIIQYSKATKTLMIDVVENLAGIKIDANDFVDAVPILAVLGCYAKGQTEITNVAIARTKESNRLACMAATLKKMGANIEITSDGLVVQQSNLKGVQQHTHNDHRIAMALSVAALGATGTTIIENITNVNKSYPSFYEDMRQLGAIIE